MHSLRSVNPGVITENNKRGFVVRLLISYVELNLSKKIFEVLAFERSFLNLEVNKFSIADAGHQVKWGPLGFGEYKILLSPANPISSECVIF